MANAISKRQQYIASLMSYHKQDLLNKNKKSIDELKQCLCFIEELHHIIHLENGHLDIVVLNLYEGDNKWYKYFLDYTYLVFEVDYKVY